MTSPIADLSYRNYDGPLLAPTTRWWAIARVAILAAFKKKSFWVMTVLSGFWYLILMIMFYFADLNATAIVGSRGGILSSDDATKLIFGRVNWNELFLHAFGRAQLWYFLIALLIGVGTIANDSRANALLVYLSKPCTKLDYIIGKWVGIFVPMLVAAAIPTFFFFAYCFMSYRTNGFLHDPWLFVKLLLMITIPAIFHASLSLAISSMFKQGRVAGAAYAGIFFFSYFLTIPMGLMHLQLAGSNTPSPVVDTLYYCSVDGIQIGLAKVILGVSGSQPIPPLFGPPGANPINSINAVPAPSGLLFTLILLGICALSVLFAWSRVRAVEVVG